MLRQPPIHNNPNPKAALTAKGKGHTTDYLRGLRSEREALLLPSTTALGFLPIFSRRPTPDAAPAVILRFFPAICNPHSD